MYEQPRHELCATVKQVCPVTAINSVDGVIQSKCYGCGRCLNICPFGFIQANEYTVRTSEVLRMLESVDALEIHTQLQELTALRVLWAEIGEAVASLDMVLALSFPFHGESTVPNLLEANTVMCTCTI
jgi:Fe-S-cluster-containing hydrogenase component 2